MNNTPIQPTPGGSTGRAALLGRAVYIEDTETDVGYEWKDLARVGGVRSIVAVPMVKDGVTLGVIKLADAAPQAFSRRQVELLETFAAQAVIAINNARLFQEVQQRTAEVTEALEQQKATAEILSVISQSVEDSQPVFEKILDSCRKLFGGEELDVLLIDENGLLQVAGLSGQVRGGAARRPSLPLGRSRRRARRSAPGAWPTMPTAPTTRTPRACCARWRGSRATTRWLSPR